MEEPSVKVAQTKGGWSHVDLENSNLTDLAEEGREGLYVEM